MNSFIIVSRSLSKRTSILPIGVDGRSINLGTTFLKCTMNCSITFFSKTFSLKTTSNFRCSLEQSNKTLIFDKESTLPINSIALVSLLSFVISASFFNEFIESTKSKSAFLPFSFTRLKSSTNLSVGYGFALFNCSMLFVCLFNVLKSTVGSTVFLNRDTVSSSILKPKAISN